MYSIRKGFSFILIFCLVISVVLTTLFVNFSVEKTFNKYLKDNQVKKNLRIIQYFEEVYKNDKGWTLNSGQELQHEAYMNNYCLTLYDKEKNVIWGMNPNDLTHQQMKTENSGIYTSKTYDITINNETVGYVSIGQYSPVLLSQEDLNFKRSINASIGFSAIIIIFAGVVASIILSKSFTRPIMEASETSVNLANGDYSSVLGTSSKLTELNNLIKSINSLGEKLGEQDALRKRLVTDIFHEIRTPLNVLQNNIEAMIDGIIPVTSERLNALNDEVIRFGKLLNNLNTLKSIENESMALKLDVVQLGGLISDVCEDFSIYLKNKNIKFKLSMDSSLNYAIYGDKDKLRQVFINLLSNAVKFTEENGSISINLTEDKENIFVEILDTGIGIKEEDVPYVFERLYRSDRSKEKIEGIGVGLSIVKNILTLHSANIEVRSLDRAGTTVIISFKKYIFC